MQQASKRSDIPIKAGVFFGEDFAPERARLRATRCSRCGETFFPPRRVCPRCRVFGTLSDLSVGPIGRISAITRVARPPSHYAHPYWLAEIDLAEAVRVLGQVNAPPDRAPQIGAEVRLTTRPMLSLPDGTRLWGYVFRLAEQPS